MEKDTLAVRAHKESIAHAMAGNKEAWLALFADDATACDPVGPSPADPAGEGFTGKERLSEFWDIMIAPGVGNLLMIPHRRIPAGEHNVAVEMTAVNYIEGMKTYVEMMVTYEVNAEGKLKSLKAYWDFDALTAQMAALQ